MAGATILLADDDRSIRTVIEQALRKAGHQVVSTAKGNELLDWVEQGKGDMVITDVMMPDANGLELLPRIKAVRPQLPVIVISAQNTLMTAVKANELGAFEYLAKPFDLDDLLRSTEKSLQSRQVDTVTENTPAPGEIPLIGRSPAMQEIYKILARMVRNDLTVLIQGESGTGKELVARALHDLGPRKGKPFVAINMAAIPRELVESELFGHEKGAFTGALSRKAGKFEQAEDGTLFLDEIGDMPMEAQTKLLRVLQEGEFTTVGGDRRIQTNVRIICATHRDLWMLTRAGEFREDLYYRLNVVPLRLPPLRERREDIGELTQYFFSRAAARGMPRKTLSEEARELLQQYDWPGNVRELENLIYRLAVLYPEPVISPEAARMELKTDGARQQERNEEKNSSLESVVRRHIKEYFEAHRHGSLPPGLYDRLLRVIEKPLIEETLTVTNGNQIRASHILGINRNTLRKKVSELGIRKTQGNAA